MEILYYKEDIKKPKTTIISEFTFINNELIKQKSRIEACILKKMLDEIAENLTEIEREITSLRMDL